MDALMKLETADPHPIGGVPQPRPANSRRIENRRFDSAPFRAYPNTKDTDLPLLLTEVGAPACYCPSAAAAIIAVIRAVA